MQSYTSKRMRPPHQPAKEEKKYAGHLRIRVIQETQSEAFITSKVDKSLLGRGEMANDLRKSSRHKRLSRRR
jgi:hypothetical protein